MQLLATPLTIGQEAFMKEAKGKGGLLGRLFVREPLYKMTLEYKKYYRILLPHTIDVRRLFAGKKNISGVMNMIVDAETGNCAVISEDFSLVNTTGKVFCDGEVKVEQEEALDIAKRYATKVLTRLSGGRPVFREHRLEEFYRPQWIAYYGNPAACDEPRYLPFEADGYSFNK